MAITGRTREVLATALASRDAANDLATAANASSSLTVPGATIAALGTTTNITAVPGSFADAAAVQTYLAGANVIPNIETRLDNLESKVDAVIAALKTAGVIAS